MTRASAWRTPTLEGLPPVTVIHAQIDPLRDDGAMLKAALTTADVNVDRKIYSGVTHRFFGMGAAVSRAADAEKLGGTALHKSVANRYRTSSHLTAGSDTEAAIACRVLSITSAP